MISPSEHESRAVLLRAYPEPAVADVARAWSNITLLRQRRPQQAARWHGFWRLAAAIALLALGGGAGWWLRAPAAVRAVPGMSVAPIMAVEPSSVPATPASGRGAVRVRFWMVNVDGTRRLYQDQVRPVPAGHDVRLRSNEPNVMSDVTPPAFNIELTFHRSVVGNTGDSVLLVATSIVSHGLGHDEAGQSRFSGARRQGWNVLRQGESSWIYPYGPPDPRMAAPAIEIRPVDRHDTTVHQPAFGNYVVVETAPRVQAVSLNVELSDSGETWRRAQHNGRLWLSYQPAAAAFFRGPFPGSVLNLQMVPPPLGDTDPICFRWEWGDRSPPSGAWCFQSDTDTVVVPLHGPSGRRLRVSLEKRYDMLPF